MNAGNCHECLLGLCYDLRHAFQGDRNFESMENNADRIAGMVGIITEPARGEMELIKAARAAYGTIFQCRGPVSLGVVLHTSLAFHHRCRLFKSLV